MKITNDRTPLFSICIPVYNAENYLRECLNSILSQKFNDYEVIMVDDGSQDASLAVCKEYERNDDRFIALHQDNSGAVAARKACLEQCTGEYVFVIDSDDYIDKDLLSRLVEIIAKHSPDIIKLNYARFDEKINELYYNKYQGCLIDGKNATKLLGSMLYDSSQKGLNSGSMAYSLWSSVAKRHLISEYIQSVPNGIRLGDDLAATAPMIYNANSVYFSNQIDYFYRNTPGSLINSFKEDELKRVEVLLKHLSKFIDGEYTNSLNVYTVNMVWDYAAKAAKHLGKDDFCKLLETEITDDFKKRIVNAKVCRPTIKDRIKLFLLRHKCYKTMWRILKV